MDFVLRFVMKAKYVQFIVIIRLTEVKLEPVFLPEFFLENLLIN